MSRSLRSAPTEPRDAIVSSGARAPGTLQRRTLSNSFSARHRMVENVPFGEYRMPLTPQPQLRGIDVEVRSPLPGFPLFGARLDVARSSAAPDPLRSPPL